MMSRTMPSILAQVPKQTSLSVVKLVRPLNLDEEKKKFYFDVKYNPQFRYADEVTRQDLEKFGKISDKYLPQALHILEAVKKKWEDEEKFLDEIEGPLLSREEVVEETKNYLLENGIQNLVQVRFSSQVASHASMDKNVLTFQLPISQRKHRIRGTLNHEVGTHFFRTMNDQTQPWHNDREKYDLLPFYETEEGLAVLHAHLPIEQPHMWYTALNYYSVWRGTHLSFSALNEDLKQFMKDRDRRWNMCLRVKRGIKDTSIPGAFSKDQVYFRGVMSMLDWLEKNEYDARPLYLGKIAAHDLPKAKSVSTAVQLLKFPAFLASEKHEEYKTAIERIRKINTL
ncbi:MAG: tyrosine/phenylalanine carboxypeptidase domain-containing protein [Patescibacteria group bacterium]